MPRFALILACAALLASAGCATLQGPDPFLAELAATPDNTASGKLTALAVPGGVRLHGRITGLQPGSVHGFHVHRQGDCSGPGLTTVGPHFNPTVSEHGEPTAMIHHAGDLANLVADAQGNIDLDVVVHGVTIGRGTSDDLLGRSLILHRDADDYTTQPGGNSGPRIACGVILKKQ